MICEPLPNQYGQGVLDESKFNNLIAIERALYGFCIIERIERLEKAVQKPAKQSAAESRSSSPTYLFSRYFMCGGRRQVGSHAGYERFGARPFEMAGPEGLEPMKKSREDIALENDWATLLWGNWYQ